MNPLRPSSQKKLRASLGALLSEDSACLQSAVSSPIASHHSVNSNNGSNDAIKVICRFRPSKVTGTSISDIYTFDSEYKVVEVNIDNYDRKRFAFDRIFAPSCAQIEVFNEVEYVIESLFSGFNGAILTYGQTAAGKSFTMEGPSLFSSLGSSLATSLDPSNDNSKPSSQPSIKSESTGIIVRAIDKLFDLIAKANDTTEFQIMASYSEVYCERLRDLLNPQQDNMKIRESKTEGFIVQDLTEAICKDKDSLLRVIEVGKTNRAAAPTLMNAESSRSHSIFSITLIQKDNANGRIRKSKLHLVDLAGSEKVSKTGAQGTRLEEAKNINSSLTTLGMVINALCEGSTHIPYRDSKLTRLLMDALGGNSKTALIICCGPESPHISETISTLRFGERAKRVKNTAHVNEELSMDELKFLLVEAKKQIAKLKAIVNTCNSPAVGPSTTEGFFQDIDDALLTVDTTQKDKAQETIDNLQETISTLKGENFELKADFEAEKVRFEREHMERNQLETETELLRGTIKDYEGKLLQLTLESKQENRSNKSNDNHSKKLKNNLPVESNTVTKDEQAPNIQSLYAMVDDVLETINSSRAKTIVSTPSFIAATSTDTAQAPPGSAVQAYSPLSLSQDQVEEDTSRLLNIPMDLAEKYKLLRVDFEKHLERLSKKLAQEHQMRCVAEFQLEQALDKMRLSSNSISAHSSPSALTSSHSGGGFFSLFIGANNKSSNDEFLSESLRSTQSALRELRRDYESMKEANAIVVESKDSVLRQLTRQNTQLCKEREVLLKKIEQLTENTEKLTNLLKNIQSRNLLTINNSKTIHGGHTSVAETAEN